MKIALPPAVKRTLEQKRPHADLMAGLLNFQATMETVLMWEQHRMLPLQLASTSVTRSPPQGRS